MTTTTTTTRTKNEQGLSLTVTVPYYVPQAGDLIHIAGRSYKLQADLEPRLVATYEGEGEGYKAHPMEDYLGRQVFIDPLTAITWRNGEAYTRAEAPAI